ncbi:MAG: YHYH protein [Solirubrobacterales bacterium]|nr:YHYH protein [Solirubrobacterales bacterium]
MNSSTLKTIAPRKSVFVAATALACLSLAACGGASASGESFKANTASTTTGIKAAKWGKNVTVTYSATKVRVKANGIPNHPRDAKYAVPKAGIIVPNASTARIINDPTGANPFDYSIPLKPTWSATTKATSLGSIGVMISGSVLYNPYEGDGRTAAMASNFFLTGSNGLKVWFVDACSGHPTPGPGGTYHYHGLPSCVVSQVDTSTGPSHIIGVAFDGYPIYGQKDIRGKTVAPSTLDKCNGITSPTPEFPNGTYHYVLTSAKSAQSSIRCFHGKVDSSLLTKMPNMGGGGPPPGGGPPAAAISSVGVQALARSASTALFCHLGSIL